ncbi:MAG: small multi-drug export protein [Anaerolineae bacterium]|nr:small multi-drug export protein [Anaerolineae bacterium]
MPSFLTTLAAASTIFGLAFFHFWSAIPAGIALGITPILVIVVTTLSYGSGAALVILVGTPLRERIRQRMEKDSSEHDKKPNRMTNLIQNAWERFGLLGLAILAPMTVGSQVGAVIGLGFGAHPWRLVIALMLGAAAWAGLITLALQLGMMTVSQV